MLVDKTNFGLLHGPPMLVDKTKFGLVLYNHANFYRFEETSSYWSVKRILVFLCFSLVSQRQTCSITVYNRTVTNIENTARAVHSCNSCFFDNCAYNVYIVLMTDLRTHTTFFLSYLVLNTKVEAILHIQIVKTRNSLYIYAV